LPLHLFWYSYSGIGISEEDYREANQYEELSQKSPHLSKCDQSLMLTGINLIQACEYIDRSAQEDRLWHYNGGQAFIKLHDDLNILIVIDHTNTHTGPTVEISDGTSYFKTYEGNQYAYSKRMREDSLTKYFSVAS
jgi:hypothetical protein